MAIILRGKSRCSICEQVLESSEDLIGLRPFLADRDHPLWRFSDSAMHRSCFLAWPKREELVTCYNASAGRVVLGSGKRDRMLDDGTFETCDVDGLAIRMAAAGRSGEDRCAAVLLDEGYVLVVADGAGGTSGGAHAAETLVFNTRKGSAASVAECIDLLVRTDQQLVGKGETTGVVAVVQNGVLWGASVGDSEAWLLNNGLVDLTSGQKRKPLIGSGLSKPVGFGPMQARGRVLLGSDGLFKYVRPERIRALAAIAPIADAAQALLDAARLPAGVLQDDICVVLVRCE